jgi:hypothetical protein
MVDQFAGRVQGGRELECNAGQGEHGHREKYQDEGVSEMDKHAIDTADEHKRQNTGKRVATRGTSCRLAA